MTTKWKFRVAMVVFSLLFTAVVAVGWNEWKRAHRPPIEPPAAVQR